MEKIEIKQIITADEKILNKITQWMYNWWGEKDGYTYEEVKCFMNHSMEKDRLPQTYGIFLNNEIIGIYQFSYEDLSIRPDIYPWLANVYICESYRNKGYARKMLETVKSNAQEKLNFNEIYLYTKHKGLYEKFGWEFISDFDTYSKEPRIQRLYKMHLK